MENPNENQENSSRNLLNPNKNDFERPLDESHDFDEDDTKR